MRYSRLSLTAALIAGAFVSFNAHAGDLLQLYKEALENDPQFASARASKIAGEEKFVQGRAGLLPTVTFSGSDSKTTVDAQRSE